MFDEYPQFAENGWVLCATEWGHKINSNYCNQQIKLKLIINVPSLQPITIITPKN